MLFFFIEKEDRNSREQGRVKEMAVVVKKKGNIYQERESEKERGEKGAKEKGMEDEGVKEGAKGTKGRKGREGNSNLYNKTRETRLDNDCS